MAKEYEIKKKELLSTISDLFSKKGYEMTSIRDIAAHVGMTNAGLYHYFANKQEILLDIISDTIDQALADMERELPKIKAAEEKLAYILQAQIEYFVKNQSAAIAFVREKRSLEEHDREIIKEKEGRYVSSIIQVVEEIIRENPSAYVSAKMATLFLMGMLGNIVDWYDPEAEVKPDELASITLSMFLNGIRGSAVKVGISRLSKKKGAPPEKG